MGSVDPANSVETNHSWLITIDQRIFNSIPLISAGTYTISLLGKGVLHFVSDESLNGHSYLHYLKNKKAFADCIEYRVTSYVCGSVLSIIPGCHATEIPPITPLANPSTEGPQKQETMIAEGEAHNSMPITSSPSNPEEDEKGQLLPTEQEEPPELTFMNKMLLNAIVVGPSVPIHNANLTPAMSILSAARSLEQSKDYASAAEKYREAAETSKEIDINFSTHAKMNAEYCEKKVHLEVLKRSLQQAKNKIVEAKTLHAANKFEDEINMLEEAITVIRQVALDSQELDQYLHLTASQLGEDLSTQITDLLLTKATQLELVADNLLQTDSTADVKGMLVAARKCLENGLRDYPELPTLMQEVFVGRIEKLKLRIDPPVSALDSARAKVNALANLWKKRDSNTDSTK